MRDFNDIVTEAYSDIAKLTIAKIYSANRDTYRNLQKRAFNISIGNDSASAGRTPEEVVYIAVDELADRIQSESETRVKVISSSEFYRNTEPAENIGHAVKNVEEDNAIQQAMISYADTEENWITLISQVLDKFQKCLPHTDIAAMAVNKSGCITFNMAEYELYKDTIEINAHRDNMTMCIQNLKLCQRKSDDTRNGIAYDVYHLIFDGIPHCVQQYVIGESEFIDLINKRKNLNISAPLAVSQNIDYQNSSHKRLRQVITMAMFISESELIGNYKAENEDMTKRLTKKRIDQILSIYGFTRDLFQMSKKWEILNPNSKTKDVHHYIIDHPVLTQQFVQKLEYSVMNMEGLKGERTRRSCNGIGCESLSIFRLINSVEDFIECEETYQIIRATVMLSCSVHTIRQHKNTSKIQIGENSKNTSKYNRQDEIKIMLNTGKYIRKKCHKK